MSWWQNIISWFFPPVVPPVNPPVINIDPKDLVVSINNARRQYNRNPLVETPDLSAIAQYDAEYMAHTGILSHGNDLNRIIDKFPNVSAGEDIGEDYQTANAMVQGWMTDIPHRAILLNTAYTRLGVGVARGANHVFWVADFIS